MRKEAREDRLVRAIQPQASLSSQATPTLEPFVHQKYVLLTTYRRDGTPVGTPVNIAVEGDRAFVRTWATAWKVKRIRNNSEVEVARSTLRGKPTGPAVRAHARILDGDGVGVCRSRHRSQASDSARPPGSAGPSSATQQNSAH